MRVRPVAELKRTDLERWFHGLVPATEDREAQRRAKATGERVRRLFFPPTPVTALLSAVLLCGAENMK
jgi:hypothetical protein